MAASAIVLTACRDRAAVTARFLDQLAAQTWRPLRVVAVDDGSRDRTPALLAGERRLPVLTLTADGRRFWGGAMALGLRAILRQRPAPDDVVVLCNDDVDLPPDFIARGMAASAAGVIVLARARQDGAAGATEVGQVYGGWRLVPRRPAPGEAATCGPTRGLFVRWEDVRHIGNFACRVLPHYGSDYEWTLRAVRRGLRLVSPEGLELGEQTRRTGLRRRHGLRGLALWRAQRSPTYAENPWTLLRLAARCAHWPRAALELPRQLARAWLVPMLLG